MPLDPALKGGTSAAHSGQLGKVFYKLFQVVTKLNDLFNNLILFPRLSPASELVRRAGRRVIRQWRNPPKHQPPSALRKHLRQMEKNA